MPFPSKSQTFSRDIKRDSFIRGAKLFTANEALILGVAGHLIHSKLSEVIYQLIETLSTCLKNDIPLHPNPDDWRNG